MKSAATTDPRLTMSVDVASEVILSWQGEPPPKDTPAPQTGALVVTAGAGVGVDSGLPDFHGPQGFWRAYPMHDLDELVLAYACSIHKSQGSEYPCVVLSVHTQHYVMLQRDLLYTGITRARKLVVLVGSKRALAIAIKNDKTEARFTQLAAQLRL